MIELNDIIDAANTLIKDKNKVLVLHKSMKVSPKFKVYKIFEYNLYLVDSALNSNTLMLSESYTINSPSSEINDTWKQCDLKVLPIIIKWFTNTNFTEWI